MFDSPVIKFVVACPNVEEEEHANHYLNLGSSAGWQYCQKAQLSKTSREQKKCRSLTPHRILLQQAPLAAPQRATLPREHGLC
jgi:hypothetical protein